MRVASESLKDSYHGLPLFCCISDVLMHSCIDLYFRWDMPVLYLSALVRPQNLPERAEDRVNEMAKECEAFQTPAYSDEHVNNPDSCLAEDGW